MAYTPQELVDALVSIGLDTTAKVTAEFQQHIYTAKIKAIDAAIDNLSIKRADALAPIENERIALTNARAALIASLPKQ